MLSSNCLKDEPIGFTYINFKEVSSTNEKAHSLALQGFKDGTVITADSQVKGRGRRGHRWHSPEGGLYCSIILRPSITTDETRLFEKIAGIAVWETIAQLIHKKPQLKIPNDILIEGKKVAGILIETRSKEDNLDYVVIGIGINCTGDLNAFPDELKKRVTTLSAASGHTIRSPEVLKILISNMNKWYKIFLAGDITRISKQWDQLALEKA
jgi:BirA family biotin operon repressor/biotin-[acetyl-CoA-carboxylase] ligase